MNEGIKIPLELFLQKNEEYQMRRVSFDNGNPVSMPALPCERLCYFTSGAGRSGHWQIDHDLYVIEE